MDAYILWWIHHAYPFYSSPLVYSSAFTVRISNNDIRCILPIISHPQYNLLTSSTKITTPLHPPTTQEPPPQHTSPQTSIQPSQYIFTSPTTHIVHPTSAAHIHSHLYIHTTPPPHCSASPAPPTCIHICAHTSHRRDHAPPPSDRDTRSGSRVVMLYGTS